MLIGSLCNNTSLGGARWLDMIVCHNRSLSGRRLSGGEACVRTGASYVNNVCVSRVFFYLATLLLLQKLLHIPLPSLPPLTQCFAMSCFATTLVRFALDTGNEVVVPAAFAPMTP